MNEIKNERYLNCKYLDAGMDGMLCSMDICTTCKEFNGENCSYFTPKNEVEQKEIEEMAKVLDEIEAIMCENAAYDTPDMAKAFYNAGYRNVKDKVVLTERELEIAMKNQYDVGFRYGCKKTAREIFDILYQWLDLENIEKYGFVTIQKFDFLRKFREIHKQCGVEWNDEI